MAETIFQEAALYSECSLDHQREAAFLFDMYQRGLRWGHEESVLDIGCGTGDVTLNVILQRLPPHFIKLVGVDVSGEMIKFARSKWKEERRVSFELVDIGSPSLPPSLPPASFDKVFSFFCLHWVRDRRQVARNIRQLLVEGGQALLVLATRNETYQAWDTIAKDETWKPYLKEVQTPLNEYQYMSRPDLAFKKALEGAGLVVEDVHLQYRAKAFQFRGNSDEDFMRRIRSFDPFLPLIPAERREEYLKDLVHIFKTQEAEDGDYDCLVVIASKPHQQTTRPILSPSLC